MAMRSWSACGVRQGSTSRSFRARSEAGYGFLVPLYGGQLTMGSWSISAAAASRWRASATDAWNDPGVCRSARCGSATISDQRSAHVYRDAAVCRTMLRRTLKDANAPPWTRANTWSARWHHPQHWPRSIACGALSDSRLHVYVLARRDLTTIVTRLATQTAANASRRPVLNSNRYDSILGGAACAQVVLEAVEANGLLGVRSGLREGSPGRAGHGLPSAAEVSARPSTP